MGTATVVLALACALVPASASGGVVRGASGELSARLADLAKRSVRTAPLGEQAETLGLAKRGPGSLQRRGSRVLVDIRFESGAVAGVGSIRSAGGKVLHVSRRYQTVTVAAKPDALKALAGLPRVEAIGEILRPFSFAVQCFGAATSEGDVQLSAMAVRTGFESFDLDGSGVKVGILSDSFNRDLGAPTGAAEDVASGDLPGAGSPCAREAPVGLLDDTLGFAEATDEGRAMAQIVHDLAPGASLEFATAFGGELGFADNIRALAAAGADVIVDDVLYPEEPFFQEGPIAVAVREVSEDGAIYFSSAGNNNLIDGEGRNIASWESPEFRDSGSCPATLLALPGFGGGHCADFDPALGETDDTFGIAVAAGETLAVDLQWSEPRFGVKTDLDVFLLDSNGDPVEEKIGDDTFLVGSGDNNVEGGPGSTEMPVEFFQWENDTGSTWEVQLAVNRCIAACNPGASEATVPRLKIALLQNGGGVTATEYPESAEGDVVGPTVFGHNGAAEAVSVGAIRFSATSAPERFSSRGPVTHYFGPVEGVTPAAGLGSPAVLAKPDLVATDGGANTFFGSCLSKTFRFFGTSAAAPHAAAIAALQLQAEPAATVAELKEAQLGTADAVGVFGPTAVGAGRVNAPAAVSDLLTEPFLPGEQGLQPPPQNCDLPPEPEPEPPKPKPDDPTQPPAPPPVDEGDRVAPQTFLRKRPKRIVPASGRKAKVAFRFGSNESGVSFVCRVDGGQFRPCRARFVRRFEVGSHTLRVMARDAAGNVDRTPATYRFKVVPLVS